MGLRKIVVVSLVLGVVANLIDFVVQGNLLASYYTQAPFRQINNIAWLVVGDFVAAAVFAVVYARIAGSFKPGPAGGAELGLYCGVLVSFPTNIFLYLLIDGLTYGLAWIWTFYGIIWYVVLGAVAGAVFGRRPVAAGVPSAAV
jgi:hypothetical protein